MNGYTCPLCGGHDMGEIADRASDFTCMDCGAQLDEVDDEGTLVVAR